VVEVAVVLEMVLLAEAVRRCPCLTCFSQKILLGQIWRCKMALLTLAFTQTAQMKSCNS
jgi:hypothetical protein